jgi:hypothetical protein
VGACPRRGARAAGGVVGACSRLSFVGNQEIISDTVS